MIQKRNESSKLLGRSNKNKNAVKFYAPIIISTIVLFNSNLYVNAETVDDLRELQGEQRVDEQFSSLEQWRISLEYAKIENHNRIARLFSSLEGIDVNSEALESKKKLTSDIAKQRKVLLTSFKAGKPASIVIGEKATLDTLVYQKSRIKEISAEITLKEIPNNFKNQYEQVAKMVEEVKEMKPIGDVGVELDSPVKNLFHLTSTFGMRLHPIDQVYKPHNGIDLWGQVGQDILSAWDGVVTKVYTSESGGNTIEITHGDNLKTLYLHLNDFNVKEGDIVKQYDTIGYLGTTGKSTGPHLHFEVHIDNEPVNPIYFFGKNGVNSLKGYLSDVEDKFYEDMRPLMESIKDRPQWMQDLLDSKPSEKVFIGERPVKYKKTGKTLEGGTTLKVKEGFVMPTPSDDIKVEEENSMPIPSDGTE